MGASLNDDTAELENGYLELKGMAQRVIDKLFSENEQFNLNYNDSIEELRVNYAEKPYRFRFVVQKYFMNVTFDYRPVPYRYILPVFHFYLTKKFSRSYDKAILDYRSDFIARTRNIVKLFPKLIETEEDVSQIIKLIMACTLTTYVSYPIFSLPNGKLRLSYMSGFYLGIAYLISDKILDDKNISKEDKNDLHVEILNFLASPQKVEVKHPLLKAFASEVVVEFDPVACRSQYEILYYLQRIQFEDAQFELDDKSIESIKEKTVYSGLKTYLSLLAVRSCGRDFDMFQNFDTNFLYSLLVQLDDDLRDIRKDQEHGIRTFYSEPMQADLFSPHRLYLALVAIFVGKNKQLSWMYSDYFSHLNKTHDQNSLDHDKIMMFVEKTTASDLKDITRQILN
jgi:hypothetical protein